jgi:UTP--glucose-1-phosphate uridylyltransferase
MACSKAIIAVAGYGTRRLPITKAIEKCMLPVGNRPIIDYVVEDCIKAGITEFYFVVGEEFSQLKRYYGHNQLLEEYLANKGKLRELDEINNLSTKAKFHYVIQDQHQPYGTAVPIALCARIIGKDEQVIVAGGDDFVFNADGSSEFQRLLSAVEHSGATAGMLAAEVPLDQVGRYGVLQTNRQESGALHFARVIEHPDPATSPSNLINITKFVFDHDMLNYAEKVLDLPPASNGEFQLTEALNLYARANKPLVVLPASGDYLDGGTTEGWLHANQQVIGTQQ